MEYTLWSSMRSGRIFLGIPWYRSMLFRKICGYFSDILAGMRNELLTFYRSHRAVIRGPQISCKYEDNQTLVASGVYISGLDKVHKLHYAASRAAPCNPFYYQPDAVTSPMSLTASLVTTNREHFTVCYCIMYLLLICSYPGIVAFLLEIELLLLLSWFNFNHG